GAGSGARGGPPHTPGPPPRAGGANPPPPPPPRTAAPAAGTAAGTAASAAPSQSYSGASGSFEQCVIQRESGGDPTAVNGSSGARRPYRFLPPSPASPGFSPLPPDASAGPPKEGGPEGAVPAGR